MNSWLFTVLFLGALASNPSAHDEEHHGINTEDGLTTDRRKLGLHVSFDLKDNGRNRQRKHIGIKFHLSDEEDENNPNISPRSTLQSRGFDELDEALLNDILPPISPKCISSYQSSKANGAQSSYSFDYTPPSAESAFSSLAMPYEPDLFLATMKHDNPNPDQSWSIRIGSGGNIYSLVGPFGEAIPPQAWDKAPFMDEVHQCVSVDTTRNSPDKQWFVHQAGSYKTDPPYTESDGGGGPNFSPNVAKYCSDDGGVPYCAFASWGQQAWIPTYYKSPTIYVSRYADCGNGVMETSFAIHNMNVSEENEDAAPVVLDYLNVPWGLVRESTLPDVVLTECASESGCSLIDPSAEIQEFNAPNEKRPNLSNTAGYTLFAQDYQDANKHGLGLVHGKDEEYNDSSYFRQPTRIRYGAARGIENRDFIVFTVNVQLRLLPGDAYVSRQYLINERYGNLASKTSEWVDETMQDMIFSNEFEGKTVRLLRGQDYLCASVDNSEERSIQFYARKDGSFGATMRSNTSCPRATEVCTGSTVPEPGTRALFYMDCKGNEDVGWDPYAFSPEPSATNSVPLRSYVCEGEASDARPRWKLLGYFSTECEDILSRNFVDPNDNKDTNESEDQTDENRHGEQNTNNDDSKTPKSSKTKKSSKSSKCSRKKERNRKRKQKKKAKS